MAQTPQTPYLNPFAAHRNVGIPLEDQVWEGERFEGQDWGGMTFHKCVFDGVTFAETALEQTTFLECRFERCVFAGCRFLAPRWVACTGSGFRVVGETELQEAVLSQCEFGRLEIAQAGRQFVVAESSIEELQFVDAGLRQEVATVSDANIGALVAERASWRDGSVVRGDLGTWTVDGGSFERCSFIGSAGEDVDLSRVAFDGCNFYQGRLAGAKFGRAERCLFGEVDLEGADFREARLSGSLFAKARARGCRFDGAVLSGGLFPEADLTGASFVGASAPGGVFLRADLTDANLERLSARWGNFRHAVLAGATLVGADLRDTDLHGVEDDLGTADTRDARGSVDWRLEREKALQRRRDGRAGR